MQWSTNVGDTSLAIFPISFTTVSVAIPVMETKSGVYAITIKYPPSLTKVEVSRSTSQGWSYIAIRF